MDSELRAALEALAAKIDATGAVAAAALQAATAAREEAATARREAGVMFEAILKEIKALPEGLSVFQRQEAERLDAERERHLMEHHIAPLAASAANHEKRITAVEKR